MNAFRPPRLVVPLLAALLFAAAARADDVSDFLQKAKSSGDVAAPASKTDATGPGSCTGGLRTATPSKFCQSFEDCRKFCSCACTFKQHLWKPDVKDDGSTTCPGAPKTGPGMLSPDSPALSFLPEFRFIAHDSKEKAGKEAVDGLRRLDERLASSADRQKYGYTVRVVSCYRDQLADTNPECGYVLKSAYMLARTSDPAQRKYWEEKGNPQNLGLAWPGATPHSAGYACDLILVDSKGKDSFDTRAGVPGAPRSSIDPRLASQMMDRELTNADVGASRLTYEAWHYEWGASGSSSRCKDPECAEKYWPVAGVP